MPRRKRLSSLLLQLKDSSAMQQAGRNLVLLSCGNVINHTARDRYSITSSARRRTTSGTASPSALAVFMLSAI